MSRRQSQKETALAKILVHALAVSPGEYGLVPDSDGWVDLKELVKALNEEEGWRHVRAGMILDTAGRVTPDELEVDEKRIRATRRTPPRPEYGETPPAHLHLGVKRKAWAHIKKRGLNPPEGSFILLSPDEKFAARLGRRRDHEFIKVTVQAHQAMDQGVIFAGYGEKLYLCDWLPAAVLMGPPVDEETRLKPEKTKPQPKQKAAMPEPDAMPGSFLVTPEDAEKPYKRKGIKKDISWKNERRKAGRRKPR